MTAKHTVTRRSVLKTAGAAALAAPLYSKSALASSGEVSILMWSDYLPPSFLEAFEAETGITPELSTTGGTSDARFVKSHCPVVEFGLVGKTMHQVDECVEVAQIHQLKAIYSRILKDYFA